MSRKMAKVDRAPDESLPVAAGDFSHWLHGAEVSLRSGDGGADVPCDACRGCCRSSMFIHIKPEETQTLRRIPRALLFPAPGLPKGHVLMGYGDQGQCPMFVNNECSIYEDRPQACRDYDCRVFAATGVLVDIETQPEIARRVKEWVFTYKGEEGREEARSLRGSGSLSCREQRLVSAGEPAGLSGADGGARGKSPPACFGDDGEESTGRGPYGKCRGCQCGSESLAGRCRE